MKIRTKNFRKEEPSNEPTLGDNVANALSGGGAPINPDEGDQTPPNPDPEPPANPNPESNQNPNPDPDPNPEPPTPSSDELDYAFRTLQTRLSTEENPYELPDTIKTGKKEDGTPLTDDEKFDILVQTIYANTEYKNPNEDDFVRNYLAAKGTEGFNQSDWLKQQVQDTEYYNLPSREYLEKRYSELKDQEGKLRYKPEDVKAYLDGKSQIELDNEADGLKANDKKNADEQRQKFQADNKKRFEDNLQKFYEERKPAMEQMFKETETIESIAGLAVTKGEIQEFNKTFEKLMEFNPETQQLKVDDLFQNDNMNLWKAVFLLNKANSGGLEAFISGVKEETKKKVLDKLGNEPTPSNSSNVNTQILAPPDPTKLK